MRQAAAKDGATRERTEPGKDRRWTSTWGIEANGRKTHKHAEKSHDWSMTNAPTAMKPNTCTKNKRTPQREKRGRKQNDDTDQLLRRMPRTSKRRGHLSANIWLGQDRASTTTWLGLKQTEGGTRRSDASPKEETVEPMRWGPVRQMPPWQRNKNPAEVLTENIATTWPSSHKRKLQTPPHHKKRSTRKREESPALPPSTRRKRMRWPSPKSELRHPTKTLT